MMIKHTRVRRRTAFALVEMVGVVALTGMLLSLSAVVLHRAFAAHQKSLSHFRESEQLQRLADRFRRDVQAAQQLKIQTDPASMQTSLRINHEQQQITYSLLAEGMQRTVSVAGVDVGFDRWPVPAGASFECSLDSSGAKALVTGRVAWSPGADSEVSTEPFFAAMSLEWMACASNVADPDQQGAADE